MRRVGLSSNNFIAFRRNDLAACWQNFQFEAKKSAVTNFYGMSFFFSCYIIQHFSSFDAKNLFIFFFDGY